MKVLKSLITEFAVFDIPTRPEDEAQFVKADDNLDDEGSQDGEFELSFGNDDGAGGEEDHPEHDPATCPCPCHAKEKGDIEDDANIEVIDGDPEATDPEAGADEEEATFSLDDSEEDEGDEESKYKMF